MKIAATLALLLALPLFAQTPYIETFEVRLHNLDVVVTDSKGEPVRGLSRADFVVLENGKAQEVTNFSVYDTSAATATRKAAAEGAVLETPAPQPVPRHFVFFIDELGVQKIAREKLYGAVKQFVDSMQEGDLASVVQPTSVEKVVQEFTTDRAAVDKAVQQAIEESGPDLSGSAREIRDLQLALRTATLPLEIRNARHEYAAAARRRVEHRLGQLRALTSSLAGIEGRKVVVLVSMALSARPGLEAWDFDEEMGVKKPQVDPRIADPMANPDPMHGPAENVHNSDKIVSDERPAIDDIARTAAANGVTIYALEPDVPLQLLARGNATIGVVQGTNQGGGHFGPDEAKDLPHGFHTDILQNAATTLDSLTEKTGGRWFRGLEGIGDTFRTVTRDLGFYYSLAYRATGNVEKARRVEVKVRNRPELRVRTRTEVIEKSTAREMEDLTIASLIYPREVNELAIEVTPGTPVPDRGYFTVPLDIIIPMGNLTFLQTGEGGQYVATFDVHFAAAGQQRDFLTGGKQQQRIELTPEQYEDVAGTNYLYKTGIKVAEGQSKIAIGVLDTTTKLTGFQTVAVDAQ
jgi:VWFA-related protein